MSPYRILFVIPSLGRRGTERQLVELLKGLDDQFAIAHVVTLVDSVPNYIADVEALGIRVTRLKCQGQTDYLRSVWTIRRLINAEKIDIVHGFLNLGSFVGTLAGRLAGVKVVAASIRDARDTQRSLRVYRAITSRLAHVFTSNSKAGFNNRYRTLPAHFRVIYNGINLERFTDLGGHADTLRASLSITSSQRCVAMVAALSEHKDYATFIEAAKLVTTARSDVVFLSIGDGPMRDDIHRINSAHGEPVRFLGQRNDVDQLWSVVDIAVMLTNNQLIEEGLPNSVMESLACGVPTIANNSGGTVEVIDHQVNGLLLDEPNAKELADVIQLWLDDTELYARLSAAAREKIVTTFSYDHYLATHRQLYADLMAT
ncbi:MAG: glycosyltransferase [Pseudomonadota bacterium]